MKKISILGSTGSIGTQTLDVVREHGDMQVVALSCGRNLSLIEKQAREFKPQFVSVSDENDAKKLRTSLAVTGRWHCAHYPPEVWTRHIPLRAVL